MSQDSAEEHARRTYAVTTSFFAGLVANGVELVVVSPGSRSTPLALAAVQTTGLRVEVVLDERSAGFVALGGAKWSQRPVALVCTSGTAAANYLPAVIEANHSGVPLVVCTADRPPELRSWGAGQTINQVGLFGSNVRWFHELPVASEVGARHGSLVAARAVGIAVAEVGPVHLNWPFREPLEPPAEPGQPVAPVLVVPAVARLAPEAVEALAELVGDHERGVVAVGPADLTAAESAAVVAFGAAAGWPVLADPCSQLRAGAHIADPHGAGAPVVATADLLLGTESFAAMPPTLVLRIGGAMTSKPFRRWVEQHRPSTVLVNPSVTEWADPSDLTTRVLNGPLETLLGGGIDAPRSTEWLETWREADHIAARLLAERPAGDDEITVARALASLPADSTLVVSSSMPVRDLDIALPVRHARLRVLANRGANGIDGVVSTAVGAAIVANEPAANEPAAHEPAAHEPAAHAPVVLFIGDLALLHDIGGLLTLRNSGAKLVIVAVDNDGGGIFSFLAIAERIDAETFELLYHTPHGMDLANVAPLGALAVERVEAPALEEALARALTAETSSLLIVALDASANRRAFAELREQLAELLA